VAGLMLCKLMLPLSVLVSRVSSDTIDPNLVRLLCYNRIIKALISNIFMTLLQHANLNTILVMIYCFVDDFIKMILRSIRYALKRPDRLPFGGRSTA
jgi:hypothetical protein